MSILSFWPVQNPSEERFPTSGNDIQVALLMVLLVTTMAQGINRDTE